MVLDLFAGAGGLSEGFVRAGCTVVGHIEMDKQACETLKTRMIYHALLKKGRYDEYKKYVLGNVTRDELVKKYSLQKEEDSVLCAKITPVNYLGVIGDMKRRTGLKEVDIIVGGPPCQAYSQIGRARDKDGMKHDERNFLYIYYVEFLKAFKPKIFVFENVPGLESAGKGKYLKDMRILMKQAGYDTDYRILNAADFGVPQNRRRVILVGWNKESGLDSYPEFNAVKRSYTVGDILGDLPRITSGGGEVVCEYANKNPLLRKLGISAPSFKILMDHVARPHNKRDLQIYKLAVSAKAKGNNIKYNELPERLKTHRKQDIFLDRFKVVDFNGAGSQTVVAHISKDGHFYIHPDPRQNRSLTVREAARLQTFPDDYRFEGPRSAQFRQIGNAVPPLLSSIIAGELVKYLS